MGRIIGIDLGTCNTSAAILVDNKPVVIPSSKGYQIIPSVVGFDEKDELMVGHTALRHILSNPGDTIYGAKRFMGKKYSSGVVQQLKDLFYYDIREGRNDSVMLVARDREFSPEEVGALILMEIKRNAEEYLGDKVREAIISVPAYFNHNQRQSVREAARIAQLTVRKIINEPTAAALAYGYNKNIHETVLIYDLGGGTFDVTVMEINNNDYRVLATTGDTFLGGIDFDNRIVEHLVRVFSEEHQVDLFDDLLAMQRLREAAEQAKISLSTVERAEINLPYLHTDAETQKSYDFKTVMTRDILNEIEVPLIERTLLTCKKALRLAGKRVDDVDEILLCGGQTRMPLIWRKIEKFFGKPPTKKIHPDEAVSLGCAIQANIFETGAEAINEVRLYDVIPTAIGIVESTGAYNILFPENTLVNTKKILDFRTERDNQTSIIIEVRQGDSDIAEENELLGFFEFEGLSPGPKGQELIQCEFFIDKQCMLTITGRDPKTDRESVVQL